ncbi:aryl-phospho-beta-D-glucosidase BglC (GH1 family) [Clostridium acetobutylicum]|uniref:Endoglucanase family 5 S-layer homology, cell-adhesion and dockerin domains n=2 Tax=Bacteria TaxID=2 RepID=Q97DK6_CLOAB|nr:MULTISPECIES: cellulase family glycosylhydrolase [Clostridium]AAK81397.1 Endoglucanase family 5; S-layer homology, cell-adhesion and dockerin domains [Clostridium acetobutylicum ATCC 824]ADZ22510.1 Endoglucanase family 5; cell-adhesion and dockerin domains [Clostridium acetobutylicum EA 2018]AEI34646.1 endoglucanase family protein [Clostridium acetobutylicum DSM 1731]AWV80935.1 endoglucanase [Clostridium acetobutylicum]MBC2393743.1 cellulase family glycosylhydrolase [Clostridium acetobutyli
MRNKKRITSLVTGLAMLFTCAVGNTSLKVHADAQSIYTTKGETTKIYASAFTQNTDDWTWMSMGDTASLVYQDVTNFNAVDANSAFAKSNSTANFGINISDGNLAEGDSSTLKFHVGTVTVKANGYDDLVINLDKDYSEAYTATKSSWGLTGNTTQILLNDYLPKDTSAKATYLQKITSVKADITLSDYQYTKATPAPATGGQSIYTTKGQLTKIYASAFTQNTDDWTWMDIGDTATLVYQDVTNLKGVDSTKNAFAKSNSTANFGINISDGNLAEGDSSTLKFHVGTVTVKADGYDDLVINLDKDYSEAYTATKSSWGLTGNTTQVLLNDYLPKDATEKANYLHKITGVTADITLSDYQYTKAAPPTPEFPSDYHYPTTMRGLSSMDLVKDMKVGWDLGNSLESAGGETGWGNPATTRKMIDQMKKAGFNTVRIPVRWDEHYTDSNYTIDPAYMSRVETVVNYALANGMYAIINIHHNKIQGEMNAENKDSVINEGSAIWKQVGDHFKDYGDQLIFETINEPRTGDDWTGNSSYYNVVNEYNAKTLSVIRATGGNNGKRLVMMPTYCASADYAKVAAMVVPNDPNVAVSIHAYIPYNFAMNTDTTKGSYSTFGDADKACIDKTFRLLDKTFIKKGIPVVVGEFAATDKNNLQDRVNFAKYYLQVASSYGIPCCWWDNNAFSPNSTDSMGIFNRKTLQFVYPEIVQAMLDGWNNPKDNSNYDENSLFSGTATSKNWGQAVSFNYGLDFVDDDFSNNLAIAVEYTSDKTPQLILQGNLTGTNWVTVNPAITKSSGTQSIAYYTLKDIVSAYKNALANYDTYGQVLPGIQTIYIGDQGTNLTVTKVYKVYAQKLEQKVSAATINEANVYFDSVTKNASSLSVTLPTDLQKIVDNGLSTCTVSYKSSDDKIAQVSQDGKITATGVGTATITTTVTVGNSTKTLTTTVEVNKDSSAALLGDVDGNGVVDSLDITLIRSYLAGKAVTINKTSADMNNDGRVSGADLMALMKKIAKGA